MYDIDLCNGINCPLKEQCSRYVLGVQLSIYDMDKEIHHLWWVEPSYKMESVIII